MISYELLMKIHMYLLGRTKFEKIIYLREMSKFYFSVLHNILWILMQNHDILNKIHHAGYL